MLKKLKIVMLVILVAIAVLQTKAQANTVEYRGEYGGLIATPNDFFLNFEELLPGDSKEDIAYIRNLTNDEVEVFFKTEPLEKTEYYDEIDYSLLEKIKLKISLRKNKDSEEEILYEGNLGAELMKEYISLGKYKKGYDGEFIFKIEIPTELRNDYTLSKTKVKWVFAVEKNEDNVNNQENNENTKDNPIKQIIGTVKTGDNIYYMIGMLVLVILITIAIIVIKKRRNFYEK